jgi:hypothetical protein
VGPAQFNGGQGLFNGQFVNLFVADGTGLAGAPFRRRLYQVTSQQADPARTFFNGRLRHPVPNGTFFLAGDAVLEGFVVDDPEAALDGTNQSGIRFTVREDA